MNSPKLVSYFRVSTKKRKDGSGQGVEGLGIQAQEMAFDQYRQRVSGTVIGSFREAETGKNDQRPEMQKALALCRHSGATLVIAKLDRLSRNASFLLSLRDSNVDFRCCDCPDADRFTVGILALVAEREREMISQRTAAGLAATKRNGTILGAASHARAQEPGYLEAHVSKMNEARQRKAEAFQETIQPYLDELRRSYVTSPTEIASCLNARGLRTITGKQWHGSQVRNLMAKELVSA